MAISGEPVEKLFLWGHSACTLGNADHDYKVLVFGGFGVMRKHSRRNDTLLLDPLQGTLKAIHTEGSPTPRLGHSSSLVGDRMFVIGGRGDPLNIMSDVLVKIQSKIDICGRTTLVFDGSYHLFDESTQRVKEKQTDEDLHRHAAAVLSVSGEWPCARHSHSMVAYGSQIYMFGGYNGEKILGDLYSFDVHKCLWKKEEVAGKSPHARFSHSMFLYKIYLGVIGGCPVGQHDQVLALLDLQLHVWKYVKLNSMSEELFLRCTANVIGDDLIMIGGGAACYAFGTKFSEPIKINLLPVAVMSQDDCHVPSEHSKIGEKPVTDQYEGVTGEINVKFEGLQIGNSQTSTQDSHYEAEPNGVNDGHQMVASHWVVQLDRKYAKLGKDILKKFGWLDLGRKAYPQGDGTHICFPITGESILLNEIPSSTALHLLKECGATKQADDVVEVRRASKSPLNTITEAVASLLQRKGLSATLLEQLPSRWERLGDIVVLPVTAFKDPVWDSIGDELWPIIAKSLNTSRLAHQSYVIYAWNYPSSSCWKLGISLLHPSVSVVSLSCGLNKLMYSYIYPLIFPKGRVAPTGTRDSTLEILIGDNGWDSLFLNATKCMFSWGNLSGKLRMARLDCIDEVTVDLFAGIGYFVLPFLVRYNVIIIILRMQSEKMAKAKLVYACEWNPHAVEALKYNLQANSVSDRCIVLEGDNRITAPKVCSRELPIESVLVSFLQVRIAGLLLLRALRIEGRMLHMHGNVKDSGEGLWTNHISKSISEIDISDGHCWEVTVEHVERVKWYAPHIHHLVVDVKCRQIKK
ncbi:hypothetical protein EZV62_026324 [Acer yangbiense]|uniref:tRNA(Phe) (4-demethylwyosine(37)-C(7)) aminocarboxypropyltransferase n=1 Tax=Acer yangbiense TaxID=1000413 RepID=A0A5C7GR89_9ROSI|nr:hypothetical protein EZV62_026324 [Acer yangbiense]